MTPEDDDNIDVACVKCGTQYSTSQSSFDARTCPCPICKSTKARKISDG